MSNRLFSFAAGLLAVVAPSTAALAQIGPFTLPGAASASPLPKEDRQREARDRARARAAADAADAAAAPVATPVPVSPPLTKLSACLSTIDGNAEGAADAARRWLADANGVDRVGAAQCLGSAEVALEAFDNASATFIVARDAAAPGDHPARARLGAMAGSAALAGGDAANALTLLDAARGDAGIANTPDDKALAAGIANDRARALVALKRDGEAGTALAEARRIDPDNAEAWLLSATLSRRGDKLAEAQAQIERAAALRPIDPEIGLEAGVIAMLAGHADAARRSWQSVLAAAPQSPSATTAQGYLAQIGAPSPLAAQTKPKEASR